MATKRIRRRARIVNLQKSYKYETNEEYGNVKISEEAWKIKVLEEATNFIRNRSKLNYCVIAFHDKDLDKDGNENLHAHLQFSDENQMDLNSLMKIFNVTNEKNIQKTQNEISMLLYFTHSTYESIKDKKYPYPHGDLVKSEVINGLKWQFYGYGKDYYIVCFNVDYNEKIAEVDEAGGKKGKQNPVSNKVNKLLTGIEENNIYFYNGMPDEENEVKKELISEFGEEDGKEIYRANKKKFIEAENSRRKIVETLGMKGTFNKMAYYISGPGESAKTLLNKTIARLLDSRGRAPHCLNPDETKNFDIADGWEGQESTIISDFSHSLIQMTTFLNIFDNKNLYLQSSRNTNKTFLSENFGLDSSEEIMETLKNIIIYSKQSKQFTYIPHEENFDVKYKKFLDREIPNVFNEEAKLKLKGNPNDKLWQHLRRFSFVVKFTSKKDKIKIYGVSGTNKTAESRKEYNYKGLVYLKTIDFDIKKVDIENHKLEPEEIDRLRIEYVEEKAKEILKTYEDFIKGKWWNSLPEIDEYLPDCEKIEMEAIKRINTQKEKIAFLDDCSRRRNGSIVRISNESIEKRVRRTFENKTEKEYEEMSDFIEKDYEFLRPVK